MLDTFIHRTVNRAFKCENIDVSIPEMVELIQTKLIDEASDDDLLALRKGMYKTWALAIGGGFNERYYPSYYRSVKLCLRFSYITHQLKEISLQDIDNNKEYYIPRGKEACKKLQRAVLRRLTQHTGGETGTKRRSKQGGKFLNQKKSPSPLRWMGLGVLGIAVAGAVLVAALKLPSVGGFFDGLFSDTPEWVSTVQNGYLGEYTDVTVYELLSSYRAFYENEVWDGGTTDNGDRIAEVRFTNPQSSDSATIQFKMLNDEVFKVSAHVDTTMPDAKSSDVLYMLNLSYYSEACLKYLGDDAKTERLHALMHKVDANEVAYGAAAGYTGDRSTLYQLYSGSLMGLSAAELMECYGTPLIDSPSYDSSWNSQSTEIPAEATKTNTDEIQFDYYMIDELITDLDQNALRASKKYKDQYLTLTGKLYCCSNDGEKFELESLSYERYQVSSFTFSVSCIITSPEQVDVLLNCNTGDILTIQCKVIQVDEINGYEVETISIEEIVPESDVQQHDTHTPDTSSMLTGTVRWSSGGLKVRSGPGTNYPEIRRLEPGVAVAISEQQNVNGTYWGKIEDGWICMDYVDVGAQQSQPEGGSSTSVNMTVCVKLSAGELRIRSGPDSSYSEVGRLYGGEIITVTELQQNGSTQWGHIPQGWICMDYVDTVYGTQEERNSAQRFVGNWIESNNANKRCMMTIQTAEYGSFLIEIRLSLSAAEMMHWYTMADYDVNQNCLQYSYCKCWISVSDGNGSFQDEVQYQDGQGKLYFTNGYLYWNDYTSGIENCPFVPD